MSGSHVAIASRAVQSSAAFHGSHSASDLLAVAGSHALSNPPPGCALDDTVPASRSPGFKTLPGLSAFDIPSFDLGSEFEKSFGFTTTSAATAATTNHTTADTLPPRPATAGEQTVGIESKIDTSSSSRANQAEGNETENGQNKAKGHLRAAAPGITAVNRHTRNRSKSMIDRPRSWLPSSKSTPNARTAPGQRPKKLAKQQNVATGAPDDTPAAKPLERSRAVESFAGFARRPWMSKSRSPSPPPPRTPETLRAGDHTSSAERPARPGPKAAGPAGPASGAPAGDNASSAAGLQRSTSRARSRASAYLTRIKQKPFSKSSQPLNLRTELGRNAAPSIPDLNLSSSSSPLVASPANSSRDPLFARNASHNSVSSAASRTPSQRASSVDTDTATASTASENASQSTAETSVTMPHLASRDPLWGTFKTLDMEFANFAGRNSTAARMAVVRSILMPFLRSTAYHPSNSSRSILTAEDTDRRATILNKWWNGLLAVLAGGNSRLLSVLNMSALGVPFPTLQAVAGVDRPMLLEAVTMLMMRPEWRLRTNCHQPLAERRPEERVRARSGSESTIESNPESLLAESAEHNIRTMFVANLTAQMTLVVDKLSLRHNPLSLVNWCGKACAYAFFFVPSVADVLVRLWGLNADLLRRVADEFGLPRRSKGESEDIVALFPPHLHRLGWSSVKSLSDRLRLAAKLPLSLAKIHWHGNWVPKWRGGETDLVFIFCKYFYILAHEFMPEGLPLVEKARAPAFVLVHAQLVSILDSTIHRQASLDAVPGPPLSDALHGADAALPAPQVPSNLMKDMDQNRLVVLLKDMLSDQPNGASPEVRHTFAEAFVAVAKCATKRTPRFEHASCFMLCDFLEEALVALDNFQSTVNSSIATSPTEETASFRLFEPAPPRGSADLVDWPFWFEVGKMIMNSNNIMSEVRILSFIFSIWDAITADPARKEALCLDWLLSEEVFAKFFNHWSPMVRAYYMRLLCWRICRDSGSANELDIKIFLVVSQRLKTVWSHYLWLKQDAEAKGRMLPSTAPCYPAPGKRFLIIRTEVQPPQQSLQVGFDSPTSAFMSFDTILDHRGSTAGSNEEAPSSPSDGGGNTPSFKKRWSLLGKVLPFGSSQNSPTTDGRRTWEEELEQARRETAASRLSASRGGGGSMQPPLGPPPPPPKQNPSTTAVTPSSDSASSACSSSVFDGPAFVFRFTLTWQAGPNGAPLPYGPTRDRILTRPRLPGPAQARVSARCAAADGVVQSNLPPTFRSDSPPPIAPGLPPETRRVSGLLQTGLVSEARNARPLSLVEDEPRRSGGSAKAGASGGGGERRRPSLSVSVTPVRVAAADEEEEEEEGRLDVQSPVPVRTSFGFVGGAGGGDGGGGMEWFGRDGPFDLPGAGGNVAAAAAATAESGPIPHPHPQQQPPPPPPPAAAVTRAERPTGVYAAGAAYAGRALAEWGIVVGECNCFVDRRRDEGVLGLSEVEVPALGVEGLGLGRQRGG